MVQCPDCEEKDKIVIAGKVFCANCGTPWQPGGMKPNQAPSHEVAPGPVSLPVAPKPQVTAPLKSVAKKIAPPPPPPKKQPLATRSPGPQLQPAVLPAKPALTSNQPEKIDNLDHRLEALNRIKPENIARHKKNERIVKEIANQLAQATATKSANIDPPQNQIEQNQPLRPIIPHSPIGDIEEGNLNNVKPGSSEENKPTKAAPNIIDSRVLAENAIVAAAHPIPSERIVEVVEAVASGRVLHQPAQVANDATAIKSLIDKTVTNNSSSSLAQVKVSSGAQRLEKATSVPQSEAINKFHSPASLPSTRPVEPKADQPLPSPSPVTAPISSKQPLQAETTSSVNTQATSQPAQVAAANVKTFGDLAKTTPVQQPEASIGPISQPKTVQTDKEQPKPTVEPPASQAVAPDKKSAEETINQLAKMIEVSSNNTIPAQAVSANTDSATKAALSTESPKKEQTGIVAKVDPPVQNVNAAKTDQASQTVEHIGSEMTSLDASDESIFSDEEFKELASTKNDRPAYNGGAIDGVSHIVQTPADENKAEKVDIPTKDEAATRSDNQPVAQSSQPKAVKMVDIVNKPVATPATTAPATPTRTQPSNKLEPPFVLPPSPDGITPGAAFRPSHTIDYPVVKPSQKESFDTDKPLSEEEALKLVHQHAEQEARLPQAKVGHSFSASSAALSLVGLLLIGAYIWQINYPNLAFKVAAGKAGISTTMPGYIPSGWKLSNNIKTSPGKVSYSIQTDNSKRKMDITTAKTDWDSQALAENYVTSQSANYLALQAQGLTIYMYGDNQASWINKGNWYRLEGSNHGLTQDQIIKIATSL